MAAFCALLTFCPKTLQMLSDDNQREVGTCMYTTYVCCFVLRRTLSAYQSGSSWRHAARKACPHHSRTLVMVLATVHLMSLLAATRTLFKSDPHHPSASAAVLVQAWRRRLCWRLQRAPVTATSRGES